MHWADVVADSNLENLPYKIELNEHGQIVSKFDGNNFKNYHSQSSQPAMIATPFSSARSPELIVGGLLSQMRREAIAANHRGAWF